MKNYVEKVLGKAINEIQLSDIENFFKTPQEETSVVEFKSGKVDINKVFKEIAAFHNTEGGLLIIGAPEETVNPIGGSKSKICQGALTYSPFQSKDWLLQKIGSNIIPYPTGITVKEFRSESGAVYLVDVPQSINPPHQCSSEGVYYIRVDNESKPAPHGFVQAMFNQRRKPELFAYVSIEQVSLMQQRVTVHVSNMSKTPADNVAYHIEIFNANAIKDSDDDFKRTIDEDKRDKHILTKTTNSVLPSRLTMSTSFTVLNDKNLMLFCISVWASDCDTVSHCYVFEASKNDCRRITDDTPEEPRDAIVKDFFGILKERGNKSVNRQ